MNALSPLKLCTLTATLALAFAPAAHAVNTLAVTATPGATTVGQPATVLLSMALPGATDLLGATIILDWNGSGLSFQPAGSAAFGLSWTAFEASFDPAFSSVSSSSGSYGVSTLLRVPLLLPAGNSSLSLSFLGLAAGNYPISYSIDLADANSTPLFAEGSVPVSVSAAVPEPSAVLLMLAGLATVGLLARRRRA